MADRHQFRAKWHDYNSGIYFVTICANNKAHLFGRISESKFIPSPVGEIVMECIKKIPVIHPYVEVWNKVVMPNHIHLVLSVGAQYIATPSSPVPPLIPSQNFGCLKPPRHGEPVNDNHYNSLLAVVVRTFKAAVTRSVRALGTAGMHGTAGAQCIAPLPGVWQRNYHEHIIRNQRAFDNIMNYIDTNVQNWDKDCFAK